MARYEASAVGAAGEIAEQLVHYAVREGGATRWVTSRFTGAGEDTGRPVLTEHDLYQGNAGIALFLWEAGIALRSDEMSSLALDALATALDMAECELPSEGYLTGTVGTGLAVATIATRAGDARLGARALSLVHRCGETIASSHRSDLTSGLAGTILAMLRLYSLCRDERLLALARDAGIRLASTARWHASGCSWPAHVAWVRRDPTGLAHGASGIALAFAALSEVFATDSFAELATLACAHEDWAANRWGTPMSDFRVFELEAVEADGAPGISRLWKQLRERRVQPSVGSIWCNGESGVLLGRSLLHGPATLQSFPAARLVAERVLRDWLPVGGSDSICHGRVGSLLGVWTFATATGDQTLRSAVLDRVSRRLQESTPWRSGTWGGKADSTLFLGDAGIGLALLHLQGATEENAAAPLIGPMLQARWRAADLPQQSTEAAEVLLSDRMYHRTHAAGVFDELVTLSAAGRRWHLRALSHTSSASSLRYLAIADRLERVLRREPPDLALLQLLRISGGRGPDDAGSGVFEVVPWVKTLQGYAKVRGTVTGVDRMPGEASGVTLLFDATREDPFVPCLPFASAVLQQYRLPSRPIDVARRLADAFGIDRESSGLDALVLQQTVELQRGGFLFLSRVIEGTEPSSSPLLEQQGAS